MKQTKEDRLTLVFFGGGNTTFRLKGGGESSVIRQFCYR